MGTRVPGRRSLSEDWRAECGVFTLFIGLGLGSKKRGYRSEKRAGWLVRIRLGVFLGHLGKLRWDFLVLNNVYFQEMGMGGVRGEGLMKVQQWAHTWSEHWQTHRFKEGQSIVHLYFSKSVKLVLLTMKSILPISGLL